MNNPERELRGIYTSSDQDSFKSRREIERGDPTIRKEWDNPFKEPSFNDLIVEAVRRREWREQHDYIPNEAEVTIKTTEPIVICNLADPHMGAKEVDYEYLRFLVDTIKNNDNAFCTLGGDMCESITWNPGQNETILNFQEQYEMLYSLLKELKGKILGGVIGNHAWEEKSGVSKWQEFLRNADAPLFDNLGWLTLNLDNGIDTIPYNIALIHKAKGYSYHNANHPQGRFSKEVEGSDIIISNHTHTDGVQSTSKSLFGGRSKSLTFINGFSLKRNDQFLKGNGNPNSATGANWLYLSPHSKQHFAIPTTELTYEVMGWEI